MENILSALSDLGITDILDTLQDLNFERDVYGKSIAILAVACLLLGSIGRYVFGNRSALHHSVSSAIGILFVYAATIVFYSAGAQFERFIAPLPFVDIAGSNLSIFQFAESNYSVICSHVLDMVILAFLANLIDGIMPAGESFLGWLLLRVLTVVGAIGLHLLSQWLLGMFLPEGLMTYAPMVLLSLLAVLVLVGSMKFLVGAVLTTVHPVIGVLYTFFFASVIGKALSKALLTTLILSGLVYGLNCIGLASISVASAALIAYIPLLLILLAIWYIVTRLMDR